VSQLKHEPKQFFEDRALSFSKFIQVKNQVYRMAKKIIVSVFLTMKAAILDTRGSTALPMSKIKHELSLFNLFYRKSRNEKLLYKIGPKLVLL